MSAGLGREDAHDPYAPPKADLQDAGSSSEAERERAERHRRSLVAHETQIKVLGTVYYVGGVASLAIGVVMAIAAPGLEEGRSAAFQAGYRGWAIGFGAVTGVVLAMTGSSLRDLRTRGRVVGAVLFALLGLFAFPIFTPVAGYVLYLLFGPRGRAVFAKDYADVVAHTPHVRADYTGCAGGVAIIVLTFVVLVVALMLLVHVFG